ncbi:unnamed protein product [Linum tenue]|uniref:Uncharacterized protein n=1 Tax=Linum tenue TaxID=586396 RepID=A0AAV0S1M8_9ROSI|nr:unnamed protein product [Linum tenue]
MIMGRGMIAKYGVIKLNLCSLIFWWKKLKREIVLLQPFHQLNSPISLLV